MVIGIGGVSRSGKSELAKKIKDQLIGKSINIISQDEFVKDKNQIPKINGEVDWEHPASIDFEKLLVTIHKSNEKYEITIVEGFLVYFNDKISQEIDFKIFLFIDEATFLKRKRADRRWGKTPKFYIEHIWQSYLKYGISNRNDMNLILNTSKNQAHHASIIDMLANHL